MSRLNPTFVAWRVRCKTVMVWSCAVTSLRVLGRLHQINILRTKRIYISYYFSTQGWWACTNFEGSRLELALLVATLLLLSKKLAIVRHWVTRFTCISRKSALESLGHWLLWHATAQARDHASEAGDACRAFMTSFNCTHFTLAAKGGLPLEGLIEYK